MRRFGLVVEDIENRASGWSRDEDEASRFKGPLEQVHGLVGKLDIPASAKDEQNL